MTSAPYRRILLKVSGEMLAGEQGYGIQPSILEGLASEIASVVALDIEVAVVIGGGNIFRGIAASASGMERASADYMGMLATVLNALALQNALERTGIMTRVQSAITMAQVTADALGGLSRTKRKALLMRVGTDQKLRLRLYNAKDALVADVFLQGAASAAGRLPVKQASRSYVNESQPVGTDRTPAAEAVPKATRIPDQERR